VDVTRVSSADLAGLPTSAPKDPLSFTSAHAAATLVAAASSWLFATGPQTALADVPQVDDVDEQVPEFFFEPALRMTGTSNVFLDGSEEWDVLLQPSAELGLNFAEVWTLDYRGELNVYPRHRSLLSHWHGLSLFVNPTFGSQGQHEFLVEISGSTLRNTREFSDINIVRPGLFAAVEMEPALFFRWRLDTRLSYRWFYDDRPSDSVDSWTRARGTFTLPSRTTLSPRVGYGFRHYPLQDEAISSDDRDQQVEAGIHASQALWPKGGLQLDYAYLHAIDDCGMISRKLTVEQFSYIDTDFLFSGHQAMLGFKQLAGEHWSFLEFIGLEERAYAGWTAVDEAGEAMDEDRYDLRLQPGALVQYAWESKQGTDGRRRFGLGIDLGYQYVRQWSNSHWYDTSAHIGTVSLWASI
jgi:hypothetical protein